MWGRGNAGTGHAREALAAWLKMRDGGFLGFCLVAAVDCIDVQIIKLETLDARSWRRRSRSTRACSRFYSGVKDLLCLMRIGDVGIGGCRGGACA
jgi:hypothetical protein